ncbi:hypothetical protein F5J12DRAFT_819997 [Pisolithus orientalis]|uniref:uncharacterized protein n=1 Tax=Pisolithus orientalis TaxID=936130 RepID=UPI0022246E3B|nr:uncharacterized protein F5J12DRAFT_819997 [Pisolithus orientalis]KAI6012726.1 hypothetical protein F5J12DRAFT_819997 [Pisolithus orientalis]
MPRLLIALDKSWTLSLGLLPFFRQRNCKNPSPSNINCSISWSICEPAQQTRPLCYDSTCTMNDTNSQSRTKPRTV